jgi:hypothetical protein
MDDGERIKGLDYLALPRSLWGKALYFGYIGGYCCYLTWVGYQSWPGNSFYDWSWQMTVASFKALVWPVWVFV